MEYKNILYKGIQGLVVAACFAVNQVSAGVGDPDTTTGGDGFYTIPSEQSEISAFCSTPTIECSGFNYFVEDGIAMVTIYYNMDNGQPKRKDEMTTSEPDPDPDDGGNSANSSGDGEP